MEISRISTMSGKVNSMNLNITQEQMDELDNRQLGNCRVIQDIFPNLKPDEREFLKTGVTSEEWDAMFGSSEEEED